MERGDEVLTQALTFIATCNALSYAGARPVFIDVDLDTMGMSPDALRRFLSEHAEMRDGQAYNKTTGRRMAACSPMHTFGHPCRIEQIVAICDEYGIPVVEDAAESLGSYVGSRHTGTFGKLATLSFNGNKVITTGGGGMIITDDEALAQARQAPDYHGQGAASVRVRARRNRLQLPSAPTSTPRLAARRWRRWRRCWRSRLMSQRAMPRSSTAPVSSS